MKLLNRWLLPVLVVIIFGFLYLPVISLIGYSFNSSKLVTVWAGFSTKWYGELLANEQILGAAWLSLKVAFISATLAVLLGTLAGFVLNRFRGKVVSGLLSWLVTAPLVLPEVIIGLSLLLLFVTSQSIFNFPAGRGVLTIVIAHTTFCMAYVAVIVHARLLSFDRSLEEAAMDLGARPARIFFDITLPIISPALVTGWLLAFILSFDDLVVASFVSGPQATTLPMVIYSKIRLGLDPQINALASLLILGSIICLVGIGLWLRKSLPKAAD